MLSEKSKIKIIKTKFFKLCLKNPMHKKEMEDIEMLRGLQEELISFFPFSTFFSNEHLNGKILVSIPTLTIQYQVSYFLPISSLSILTLSLKV